jgi:DNA polymerase
MALTLDPRQVAMLQEMGLRLLPPVQALQPDAPAPAAGPATGPVVAAPAARALPVPDAAAAPGVERSARPDTAPVLPRLVADGAGDVATLDWDALHARIAGCQACGLCASRRNTVPGVGPQRADWMVVGEAPGEQEDLRGEPFVGPAGQLLDAMLRAIGLDRGRNVYIANVLKCRPPGNRNPEPQEMAQCEPYLQRQIALVQPKVILAMGRFALQALLRTTEPVGRLRGRVHAYEGVPVVVTYHPAYLLRNLADKGKAWSDLCLALEVMDGRMPPGAAQSGGNGL